MTCSSFRSGFHRPCAATVHCGANGQTSAFGALNLDGNTGGRIWISCQLIFTFPAAKQPFGAVYTNHQLWKTTITKGSAEFMEKVNTECISMLSEVISQRWAGGGNFPAPEERDFLIHPFGFLATIVSRAVPTCRDPQPQGAAASGNTLRAGGCWAHVWPQVPLVLFV